MQTVNTPVLRNADVAGACEIRAGRSTAGLRLVEVTRRTPAALAAIAAIARQVERVVVGAGTVQRPADVVQACTAGGTFWSAPGLPWNSRPPRWRPNCPYLPGVATPSES